MAVTQVELASLARHSAHEGEIQRHEAQLIEHVLRLDTVRARDLMTPRTVVVALSDQSTLEEIRESALHWAHSRLPVYRGDNPDDIYAVCFRRNIFDAIAKDEIAGKTIADYSRKIDLIPESLSAHLLLDKFINSRRHIAAVIDEFGAFVGVVTLEDVIECLLGKEIVDEYDLHADMQLFARDQARQWGLPVKPAESAPAAPRDSSAEKRQ
jgi:CBS domain containing-hemolysin-like protein